MAGRFIMTHNRHIVGLIPTLWKVLRTESFANGKITAIIPGRKYGVSKFLPGLRINVVGTAPNGLKVIARLERDTQEVCLHCM